MRIKNYDYDSIKNLKNPLGNYQEVLDFIQKTFNVYKEYEDWLSYYDYKNNDFICCLDKTNDTITFYKKDNNSLGLEFYNTKKYSQPYIRNQEYFNDLKHLFLNYKLKEKLQKELVVNTIKRKVNKI